MISLTIKHSDGDKSIQLVAETMKELIDEKLPLFLPRLSNDLPLLKKTTRFQLNPETEEAKERASGWYYDVDSNLSKKGKSPSKASKTVTKSKSRAKSKLPEID